VTQEYFQALVDLEAEEDMIQILQEAWVTLHQFPLHKEITAGLEYVNLVMAKAEAAAVQEQQDQMLVEEHQGLEDQVHHLQLLEHQ
jgi:hypothetical protein